VDRLSEELQCTVREMLKELESDKATGRYVVWLRFTRAFEWTNCYMVEESLAEFFQGEFCYNLLFPCYDKLSVCPSVYNVSGL